MSRVEPCPLSVDLCHRKRPVSELRSHSLNILYVTKYVLNMYNRDPSETRTLWRWWWSLSGTFCLNEGQHTFVTDEHSNTTNTEQWPFIFCFLHPPKSSHLGQECGHVGEVLISGHCSLTVDHTLNTNVHISSCVINSVTEAFWFYLNRFSGFTDHCMTL